MLGKTKKETTLRLFEQPIENIINKNKLLYKLANKIDWDFIENNLKQFYSKKEKPSYPIRLMAGLLILKYLRNISDEILVDEQWEENIFYQYFCGMQYYEQSKPRASSDMVHFRKRIGEKGIKVIFEASIKIHNKENNDKKPPNNKKVIVYADTTVQHKNITYPTDAKLQKSIIDSQSSNSIIADLTT